LSYAVRSVRVCDILELSLVPSISMQSSNMIFDQHRTNYVALEKNSSPRKPSKLRLAKK
jgi:hypothetical protein